MLFSQLKTRIRNSLGLQENGSNKYAKEHITPNNGENGTYTVSKDAAKVAKKVNYSTLDKTSQHESNDISLDSQKDRLSFLVTKWIKFEIVARPGTIPLIGKLIRSVILISAISYLFAVRLPALAEKALDHWGQQQEEIELKESISVSSDSTASL